MLTNEDLKRDSLEWIDGKLRIVAKFNSNNVLSKSADLYIYPDHPRSKSSIKLLLEISEGDSTSVKVQDLLGNGHRSKYQGKGYGKLLFRIAVQCLKIYFENKDPATIQVLGSLSDAHDPSGSAGKECHNRRANFWSSLGFVVHEPDNPYSQMTSSLDTLISRLSRDTDHVSSFGLKSRYVNIHSFWVRDERPLIQQGDIEFIEDLDMNIWPQQTNPSEKKLAAARDFHHKATSAISYSILFFLLIACIWLSLKLESGAPFIVFILAPFLSAFIENYFIQLVPPLNKLDFLLKKRDKAIENNNELEKHMNLEREGINHRLRIALSNIFPNLNFHEKEMSNHDLIVLIKQRLNSPEVTAAIRPNRPIQ